MIYYRLLLAAFVLFLPQLSLAGGFLAFGNTEIRTGFGYAFEPGTRRLTVPLEGRPRTLSFDEHFRPIPETCFSGEGITGMSRSDFTDESETQVLRALTGFLVSGYHTEVRCGPNSFIAQPFLEARGSEGEWFVVTRPTREVLSYLLRFSISRSIFNSDRIGAETEAPPEGSGALAVLHFNGARDIQAYAGISVSEGRFSYVREIRDPEIRKRFFENHEIHGGTARIFESDNIDGENLVVIYGDEISLSTLATGIGDYYRWIVGVNLEIQCAGRQVVLDRTSETITDIKNYFQNEECLSGKELTSTSTK